MTAPQLNDPALPDYMLSPAARLLWRSPDSVHLELGDQAVIVDGLPTETVRRVAAQQVSGPRGTPADPGERQALIALAEAGYLWPRQTAAPDARIAPPSPRLAGQLTSLATQHGQHAAQLLRARQSASVQVSGPGRLSAHLAAVLAAAGVGRVHCSAAGDAKLQHTMPGGVEPRDEGRVLSYAIERAVHRAAPDTDTTPPQLDERPDLTILVLDAPVTDERRAALHAVDAPYLAVTLGLDHGVVGPLVLPGLTSCLRCADLHRADRDPAWPALAVQLSVAPRYGHASDVAVATVIAGAAALQALTFLDGAEPAVIDATVELRLPDWRLRRRSWPLHPDCDCADIRGTAG